MGLGLILAQLTFNFLFCEQLVLIYYSWLILFFSSVLGLTYKNDELDI